MMKEFIEFRKKFGVKVALTNLALRLARHFVDVRVIKWISLDLKDIDKKNFQIPDNYQAQMVDALGMSKYCSSEYEIGHQFLKQVGCVNDKCFLITSENMLASYGWYSTAQTELFDNLYLDVPADHVYMYKGFTHKNHRGKRLHGINMALALKEYNSISPKKIISYVEIDNCASLNSCYRLGYKDIGQTIVFIRKNRTRFISNKIARSYGVRLSNFKTSQFEEKSQSTGSECYLVLN